MNLSGMKVMRPYGLTQFATIRNRKSRRMCWSSAEALPDAGLPSALREKACELRWSKSRPPSAAAPGGRDAITGAIRRRILYQK